MRRAALGALLLLAACSGPSPQKAAGAQGAAPGAHGGTGRVDPAQHDAFFLWAGVPAPPVLGRARTIYLLDGEVRAHGPARFTLLRPQAPRATQARLWLTIRLERLDWPEDLMRRVPREIARWRRAGARVVGLTLDFDTNARGLAGYAAFLARVRRHLPPGCRLSVTGLMDWSANADPAALAGLAGTVDEVIVQTYQGRRTLPDYARYVARLRTLPLPFRIALVEGGAWQAPPGLEQAPGFRGYVVFLLPRKRPG